MAQILPGRPKLGSLTRRMQQLAVQPLFWMRSKLHYPVPSDLKQALVVFVVLRAGANNSILPKILDRKSGKPQGIITACRISIFSDMIMFCLLGK